MVDRKHILKRSVTNIRQKIQQYSPLHFATFVSVVPKRCMKNKLIGYILRTCIFENSMNFKNLQPIAVVE